MARKGKKALNDISPVAAVRVRRVRMMTKKWRNARASQEPGRPRPH